MSRSTAPLVCLILVAGCHPARPDAAKLRPDAAEVRPDAANLEYTGGCVDFVTLADGSIECAKRLEDLGAGWNCCAETNNECKEGANTVWQDNSDGSSTLVVHCGKGYYPVFCQDSKIGLICTTTEQLP